MVQIDINRDENLENNQYTLFYHKKKLRNSGTAENRTSWRETEKTQSQLATTCNKNEQQDAEL